MNRQDISNRIYYGMRPLCYNFVLPGTPYDEPSVKNVFTYDPAKANTLYNKQALRRQ